MARWGSPYGPDYERRRKVMLAENPVCWKCGRPATEADHDPPLAQHHHVNETGCCRLLPSCARCQRKQGAEIVNARLVLPVVVAEEPDGYAVEDAVWDVPWLTELRKVPADATWPRLMTAPHPDAVGSYGEQV